MAAQPGLHAGPKPRRPIKLIDIFELLVQLIGFLLCGRPAMRKRGLVHFGSRSQRRRALYQKWTCPLFPVQKNGPAPFSRPGFTLFELILAIGLSSALLALIGTAINLYLVRVDASRSRVEEAQLARTVL